MKKFLEKLVLWVAHYFGAEKQMIPSLHTMPADKIMIGRMYEWYGRVVKAVSNPEKVKTVYLIWPNKDMSQQAVALICNNTDKLQMFDTMYRTTDVGLGEALKADGSVEITEETTGEPCKMCCMYEKLPCPTCDFKTYWVKVAEKKQHCTDQKAWARMMERRIGRH